MAAETVSFTRMQDGTREDYALLARHEVVFAAGTADRVLATCGGSTTGSAATS